MTIITGKIRQVNQDFLYTESLDAYSDDTSSSVIRFDLFPCCCQLTVKEYLSIDTVPFELKWLVNILSLAFLMLLGSFLPQ